MTSTLFDCAQNPLGDSLWLVCLEPGGWVAMPPRAVQAVEGNRPARFLLTLVKEPAV